MNDRAWPAWVSSTALVVCVAGTAAVLVAGANAPAPLAFVLLAVVFAALGALLVAERRRRRLTARAVGVGAGLLLVLAVAVPPVMSRDLWSYAMYGRIVAHYHASPYQKVPAAFPHDPILREVSPAWRGTASVYGPAFTWLSAAGMAVAGPHPLAARLFFQGLAALAVALALAAVHRRTRDPRALACIGLNPVVIVTVVNAGHNDALVALALLGAVLLATRRRLLLAAVAVGLAALVKLTALLALVGLALWVLRHAGLRRVVATGLVCGAVVVVGYGVGGGADALRPLADARLRVTGASPWNKPRIALTHDRVAAGESGGAAGKAVRKELTTVAGLLVAGLATVAAWRRRRDATPALAVAAALVAYTLLGTYVLTWYLGPVIVVGALSWRSPLTWLAMIQGALLELAYVPDVRFFGKIHDLFAAQGPVERVQLALRANWLPPLEIAGAVALVALSVWPPAAWPHRLRPRRVASAARG